MKMWQISKSIAGYNRSFFYYFNFEILDRKNLELFEKYVFRYLASIILNFVISSNSPNSAFNPHLIKESIKISIKTYPSASQKPQT